MENNNKIRELYSIYLELGHEVFEEKIKKPMELYLHASSNVISMNSLNTIIANAMENSKLGDVCFDEHDIFSPPNTEENIYFDDTMPPIYDDYNDDYVIFSPPTIEEKINYDYNMPPILDDYGDDNNNNDSYFVEFAPTTINKNDYTFVESNNSLCMRLKIRMFYVIVILWILSMMLLKVIMREGNMVICISIILSFPSLC